MVSRKLNRSRKQQSRKQQQRGGNENCATDPVIKTNNCLGDPDVSNYIWPCKNLTANQFGFKDLASYNGGSRKRSAKKQQRRQQRGSGDYPGVFGEHIYTPYSDWAIGLGENPGITTQMEADASGPGQAGGRRRSQKKQQQQRRSKKQQGGTALGSCAGPAYDDFFKQDKTGGSRRQRRSRKQRSRQSGGCGDVRSSCLASNPGADKAEMVYANEPLGKTAISDGSPYDLPSPSELAWFFRNSYGATPSTNVVSQKGGRNSKKQKQQQQQRRNKVQRNSLQSGGEGDNVFFGLDEKIGGLPRVDHTYGLYQPSMKNLVVNGAEPSQVEVVDQVDYNLRNRTADVVGALENSSLTRDSFEIPETMAMAGARTHTTCQKGGKQQQQQKKKNYLTRKSRNQLFGGQPADFPQSFDGAKSDFSADMTTRSFDCHQPNWCPKCT